MGVYNGLEWMESRRTTLAGLAYPTPESEKEIGSCSCTPERICFWGCVGTVALGFLVWAVCWVIYLSAFFPFVVTLTSICYIGSILGMKSLDIEEMHKI